MSENYSNTIEAQLGRAHRDRVEKKARIAAMSPEERKAYRKDKIKDVGGDIALWGLAIGVLQGVGYGVEKAFNIHPNHGNAPVEQSAPASHSTNHSEFTGSNGQRVNLQTHEQAQETLAQLHK